MLADELEKLYNEHRAGQHVNDGRMRVPESMVKLAIRQLRAAVPPEGGARIIAEGVGIPYEQLLALGKSAPNSESAK